MQVRKQKQIFAKWHGVAWEIFTNISEKLADLIFRAEDVSSGFFWNVGKLFPGYTAPHPGRKLAHTFFIFTAGETSNLTHSRIFD